VGLIGKQIKPRLGRKKYFSRCDFSVAPAGAFSVVNLKPTACAVGYYRTLLRSFSQIKLRSQPFAVGLVVAVPATQGGVAGVGEKKWQRRRFNVAIAKYHVGFSEPRSGEKKVAHGASRGINR
jgi:hypothetical protein